MKLYDVDGYDRPLRLSEEHAALLGATEHDGVILVPARNAPKAEWLDYAVAVGGDPAFVGSLTKADLIDPYGG